MNSMALPEWFLDWWFAPWEYADGTKRLAYADDALALRDGYRLWCDQTGLAADLPAAFDADWHIACTTNGDELRRTARLFAGLFAARVHEQEVLSRLSIADRKWCAGIASVQPVKAAGPFRTDAQDGIEVGGLAQLAARIETSFPGLWSRLRLMVPESDAGKVDALLQSAAAAPEHQAATARVRRCWQMCRQRASASPEAGAA